jgi:hypothetical protein
MQIAELFKADVGLEVAFLDSGGWDHHVNEGGVQGQLANLLRDLGQGIAARRDSFKAHARREPQDDLSRICERSEAISRSCKQLNRSARRLGARSQDDFRRGDSLAHVPLRVVGDVNKKAADRCW